MTKSDIKTYYARADGWIAGQRVKAGDPVKLTARAAAYENVTDAQPAKPAAASKAKKVATSE